MEIEIIESPLKLELCGFSAVAVNKDYAGTAFKLSGKMWEVVKANGIKNKGKNIWVYESDDRVFAGVELEELAHENLPLEQKSIQLMKYAYFKHVGPYGLIKQIGRAMNEEIRSLGFETTLPYIEIYGHWDNDESKLETELIMSISSSGL